MTTLFTPVFRFGAVLFFAALATSANANCMIYDLTSSADVKKAFKDHDGYDFQNYSVVCNKLRKANAKISISGYAGVLSNRSFGWADVSVADKSSNYFIVNSYSSAATKMHDYASEDKAHEMLWLAINDALNRWVEEGLDQALAELNQARQAASKAAKRQ